MKPATTKRVPRVREAAVAWVKARESDTRAALAFADAITGLNSDRTLTIDARRRIATQTLRDAGAATIP